MIINQKDVEALYITDNKKEILCIIDDDNIVNRNGFEVHIIEDASEKEHIRDIAGTPYLSM